MLIKITLIVSILVVINFLLLKFSCNKTIKSVRTNKAPLVLKPELTIELDSQPLAPTGS